MSKAKPKVFIQGPSGVNMIQMFLSRGYTGTRDYEEADMVVFTGGADVDPALYHEHKLAMTHVDLDRDAADIEVYTESFMSSKYLAGICRGGQFLNVMAGGKLWQDVNNHGRQHEIIDAETSEKVLVSSTHHQSMRPDPAAIVLATASQSTWKLSQGCHWTKHAQGKLTDSLWNEYQIDYEAVYYEHERSLCFQPHPEYNKYVECQNYFFDLIKRTGGPVP